MAPQRPKSQENGEIVVRSPAGARLDGRTGRAGDRLVMGREVSFGRHRFDPRTGQLWAGPREVKLTPRASAVLAVLIERAGEPVTRAELFRTVWGDTVVGDAALTACIQELRGALADDARRPRFIETRHRRGYRFLATVGSPTPASSARHLPPSMEAGSATPVVGRHREL